MGRKNITVRNVDEDTWVRFEQLILSTQGTLYGNIGPTLSDVLDIYLESACKQHQASSSAMLRSGGERADVQQNIEAIKNRLRMSGFEIRLSFIDLQDEVQQALRLKDRRTIKKYIKRLLDNGYIIQNADTPLLLEINPEWLGITPETKEVITVTPK